MLCFQLGLALYTGQLKASSPDLTLNEDFYREQYQTGLNLGIEIILEYPAFTYTVAIYPELGF